MGQLDTRAAGIAAVARDEKHIAFIRDPVRVEGGCVARGASFTTGTLIAATIQPDGSFCERVVAGNVSQHDVAFSDDSRSLVFRDVDDCGGRGRRAGRSLRIRASLAGTCATWMS
jgi:hypothetical protein